MQKLIIFFGLLLTFINLAFSQGNINEEMLLLQENVYLHFNKAYYYSGERVWFHGFMLYADDRWKDTLSKVLYAELLDNREKVLKSMKFRISKNTIYGDFRLSDSLIAGNYFLRTYTNWMRNYGDTTLQYFPINIIDKNKLPKSNIIQQKHCNYLNNVKDTILINNALKVNIDIPSIKSYSISIYDTLVIKKIDYAYKSTIYPNFESYIFNKIDFPIERNIVISGVMISNSKKKKKINYSGILKSTNELTEGNTDNLGLFSYNWFGETLKDELIITAEKNFEGKIIINENKKINTKLPKIQHLQYTNTLPKVIQKDTLEKDAILLNEVLVKTESKLNKLETVSRLYGKPDFSIKGDEIKNALVENPLLTLQGRVPGLTVFYINGKMFIDIRGSSKTSFRGEISNPTILVNGFPFGSADLNDLAAISIKNIVKIDVVKHLTVTMGAKGASGIINIITQENGNSTDDFEGNISNVTTIPIIGYDKINNFPINEYQPYWEMVDKIDKDNIDFKITKAGNYILELVGKLENGSLVKCNKYFVAK